MSFKGEKWNKLAKLPNNHVVTGDKLWEKPFCGLAEILMREILVCQ